MLLPSTHIKIIKFWFESVHLVRDFDFYIIGILRNCNGKSFVKMLRMFLTLILY